jgi:hypothetical protein
MSGRAMGDRDYCSGIKSPQEMSLADVPNFAVLNDKSKLRAHTTIKRVISQRSRRQTRIHNRQPQAEFRFSALYERRWIYGWAWTRELQSGTAAGPVDGALSGWQWTELPIAIPPNRLRSKVEDRKVPDHDTPPDA